MGVGPVADDRDGFQVCALAADALKENARLAEVLEFEHVVAVNDWSGFGRHLLFDARKGEIAGSLANVLAVTSVELQALSDVGSRILEAGADRATTATTGQR